MHVCDLGCVIPMASFLTTVLSVVRSSSTTSYPAWRWWCSLYDCRRRRLDPPNRRCSSFAQRNCPSFCLKLLL